MAAADLHGLLLRRWRPAAADVLLLQGLRCLDLRALSVELGPPGTSKRAAHCARDERMMKAGEAQVGQKVRTLVHFTSYPKIKVGSFATIVEVVAQDLGAQDDALLIHPHQWREGLCLPCNASEIELVC